MKFALSEPRSLGRRVREMVVCPVFLLLFSLPGYCDYRKGLELYKNRDFPAALREFRSSTDRKQFDGYQEVIRELAGLNRSPDVTVNLGILGALGIAAENGPPETQLWMSHLWSRFGVDVPNKDPERVRWLTLAANGGNAEAAWQLWAGPALVDEGKGRVFWLTRAAELGDERAQRTLASSYIRGLYPFQKNLDEGMRWARIRAGRGDAVGLAMTGYLYTLLPPEERVYPEAVEWLRKAWSLGFRVWPVPHSLIKLHDEHTFIDATEEELKDWRRAAATSVRPIID